MIISRFYCRLYLFEGCVHCDVPCLECDPPKETKTVNEKREPIYFVWEKVARGIGAAYQAAKYRGMPKTGKGDQADKTRFLYCEPLSYEEASWTTRALIEKYPCPPAPPEDV